MLNTEDWAYFSTALMNTHTWKLQTLSLGQTYTFALHCTRRQYFDRAYYLRKSLGEFILTQGIITTGDYKCFQEFEKLTSLVI